MPQIFGQLTMVPPLLQVSINAMAERLTFH
jgi:hypothetical protein